ADYPLFLRSGWSGALDLEDFGAIAYNIDEIVKELQRFLVGFMPREFEVGGVTVVKDDRWGAEDADLVPTLEICVADDRADLVRLEVQPEAIHVETGLLGGLLEHTLSGEIAAVDVTTSVKSVLHLAERLLALLFRSVGCLIGAHGAAFAVVRVFPDFFVRVLL